MPRGPNFPFKRKGFPTEGFGTFSMRAKGSSDREGIASESARFYKRVDTCAAEFATRTAYMYSTYEDECEALPTQRKKVIVLGGGPESHRTGYRIRLLLRSRGARAARRRIRDDPWSTATRKRSRPTTILPTGLYFEPLTLEGRPRDRRQGKTFRSDRPVRRADPLETRPGSGGKTVCPSIGTTPDMIDMAEDRERFQQLIDRLGLSNRRIARARTESRRAAPRGEIGYPLVVRPSYVLGGRAMEIVHEQKDLERYMRESGQSLERLAGAARPVPERRHGGGRGRGQRRRTRTDRRLSWNTSSRPGCIPAIRRAPCRRIL